MDRLQCPTHEGVFTQRMEHGPQLRGLRLGRVVTRLLGVPGLATVYNGGALRESRKIADDIDVRNTKPILPPLVTSVQDDKADPACKTWGGHVCAM